MCCASEKTALLLEKNVSEIGRLIKYHTETPVSIDIRQEETLLLSWNRDQGHSRGRNPENGNGKKKQDGGGRNNEVAAFIAVSYTHLMRGTSTPCLWGKLMTHIIL